MLSQAVFRSISNYFIHVPILIPPFCKNVMTPQSFLYEEPEFLLRQEVQDVGSYFSIIRAIASGNMRISDIASALSLPATSLSKPLKTLCDLDILEREVPPTEKNIETSKKGQYRIKDNFLAFWFRFVYPMRSFIESDHPEIAMTKLKTGFIPNHVGYVYEDICRQKMWELNAQGKLPFLFDRVGRWWGGKIQKSILSPLIPQTEAKSSLESANFIKCSDAAVGTAPTEKKKLLSFRGECESRRILCSILYQWLF